VREATGILVGALLRNVLLVLSVAAALVPRGALAQVPAVGATAEVRDTANRLVATAEFREGRGEVLITLRFPSPPVLSGTHGIHIDEVGRCDPPDFLSAGNIFNPFGKKHGRQNPEGVEVGDLPNVNFTTGLTAYNTSAPGATLAAGSASLLNPSRSVVIHMGEDDQKTDPEGNAGPRIACGVITAAAGAAAATTPTATRPAAPAAQAAPTVASPAPAQPAQPAPAQPAAAQPAARPANSPVVVRPPAVVNPAASPSPGLVAAGATPIVAPTPVAAPPLTSGSTSNNGLTTLVIAVLGVGLVGAGYLLRRGRQVQ
jgi:Cu-Zn family superoxide dismutase